MIWLTLWCKIDEPAIIVSAISGGLLTRRGTALETSKTAIILHLWLLSEALRWHARVENWLLWLLRLLLESSEKVGLPLVHPHGVGSESTWLLGLLLLSASVKGGLPLLLLLVGHLVSTHLIEASLA